MNSFQLDRILVPVDGSLAGDAALSVVDRLPGTSPELLLLRVVPRHSLRPAAEREVELHEALRHLSELERRLRQSGHPVSHLLCAGDPAEQILGWIRLLRPSLVAMSARGAGRAVGPRGSVAEAVLARCPVPLLLGSDRSLPLDPGPGFARVLLPLDGSETSARVLPLVATLAQAHRSELVLVHVDPDQPDAAAREAVLRPFQRRLEAGGLQRVRLLTACGDPAQELVRAIEAEGADLLAMTSHSRPDPQRRWFGSTAESILRAAACPLLVVRIPGPPV